MNQCGDCLQSFSTAQALERHKNKKIKCTDPAYKYQCIHCHKKFTDRGNKCRHQKECTGRPPLEPPANEDLTAVVEEKVHAMQLNDVDSVVLAIKHLITDLEMCDTNFPATLETIKRQFLRRAVKDDDSELADGQNYTDDDSDLADEQDYTANDIDDNPVAEGWSVALYNSSDEGQIPVSIQPSIHQSGSREASDRPSRLGAIFHVTNALKLQSATNLIDLRDPQFYMRQVFGKWAMVHPVGRPDQILSAEQLAEFAVIKIGSQSGNTGRQHKHTTTFSRSQLLDSCLTKSFTYVEMKAKDIWLNSGELYEGLYEGKNIKDTELLLVRSQDEYARLLSVVQQLCNENDSLSLRLAQETSRQMEADACKAQFEFEKLQLEFEMHKFEVAQQNC